MVCGCPCCVRTDCGLQVASEMYWNKGIFYTSGSQLLLFGIANLSPVRWVQIGSSHCKWDWFQTFKHCSKVGWSCFSSWVCAMFSWRHLATLQSVYKSSCRPLDVVILMASQLFKIQSRHITGRELRLKSCLYYLSKIHYKRNCYDSLLSFSKLTSSSVYKCLTVLTDYIDKYFNCLCIKAS